MEPKPWMKQAGLLAVTALLLAGSPGAAALPTLPTNLMDDDPTNLVPPGELGDTVRWALVTFEGSTAITAKPLEIVGVDPQNPTAADPQKVLNAVKAGGNQIASSSTNADQSNGGAFDLHVIDWPGGMDVTQMSLLISQKNLPSKVLTVDMDEFRTAVVFLDVPVISSANYALKTVTASGTNFYSIAPLVDLTKTLDEQVCLDELGIGDDCVSCGDYWLGECLTCTSWLTGDCLVEPMGEQAMGMNPECTRDTTVSRKEWERYDRGWIGSSQTGWTDLAWGGWQYKFTYGSACGYVPNTVVKPAYGFGFRGLSRMPVGGTYETHFGADWTGHRQTSCQNYGGYSGYKCNGDYVYLHSPTFTYRNPAAPGATHKSVSFGDLPSQSCSQPIPAAARAALSLVGLKYNWVGLFTRAIPNYVCTTNWNQLSNDGTGSNAQAAMGAQLNRDRIAWNDDGQRATGYIRTEYLTKTPGDFKMDMFARVNYDYWANICGNRQNCYWATDSGSNFYEVLPAARVV